MFWMIVGAVLVVVLAAAKLYDRKRKAPPGGIKGPEDDPAVQRGRAQVNMNNIRDINRGMFGP